MAPHSSTLAWKIPWAEEPGGLQSMGSLLSIHLSLVSELQYGPEARNRTVGHKPYCGHRLAT